jgi:MATE family multidrug resistance protein
VAHQPSSRLLEVTHRSVLAIALPMTLAYLTTPLVGIVNLGAVGQLGDPAPVGGVAIGALVFDIVFLTFNFLRAGTTGLVAQALGAGDRREIAATLARALLLAAAIGLAILIFQQPICRISLYLIGGSAEVQEATSAYWQARVFSAPFALANYVVLGWLIGLGRAGWGLALQIVLNGINMILSVVLVIGFHLGPAGVGWASFVAETVTALAGLALVLRFTERSIRPRWSEVFDRDAFRRMVAINRDIMIRTFALLFAFAFFTARSAAAGDVVLAANEILINLIVLAAYFLDGLAAAAEQLAGRAIGARHRPAFERAVWLTVGWGFGVGAIVSLAYFLAGPILIDLMTTNAEVRETARDYLVLAALFPITGTLAYQMDGVFIGATWSVDMRNMMLVALTAYLAAWWVLENAFGVSGLWLALLVFLAVRGLTLVWRARVRIGPAFGEGR